MAQSIGQFIAILRKSKGLTQKELAERLNVSDKAVSRWEREESLPDLTLIPTIAELFGVTSDELLRGEYCEKQPSPTPKKTTNILFVSSGISVTLTLLGLISALIASFSFGRIYLAFFLGLGFFLVASICEIVLTQVAFSSCEQSEKQPLFRTACNTFILMLTVFAECLPVSLFRDTIDHTLPVDTEWLFYLLIPAIALLVGIIGKFIAERIAVISGLYVPINAQAEEKLWKLRKKISLAVALSTTILTVGLLAVAYDVSPLDLVAGKEFYDFESFKEYIETGENLGPQRKIIGEDGTTYTYRHNNEEVKNVLPYTAKRGKIITYTYEDYAIGEMGLNHIVFGIIFCFPVNYTLLCVGYFKKKKKMIENA